MRYEILAQVAKTAGQNTGLEMNQRIYEIRNTFIGGKNGKVMEGVLTDFGSTTRPISNKSNISNIIVAQSTWITGTIPSDNCIFKSI